MRITLLAALALAAGCATTAASGAPATSWGKANVPMTEFLADAANCAASAAAARAQPEVLVQSRMTGGGSATPGTADAAQASNDALLAAANDQRTAQIRADQRARQLAHDQCLRDRGYTQFRLTAEQRRAVQALPEGSAERRAYLHRVGSDPAVLAAQRV